MFTRSALFASMALLATTCMASAETTIRFELGETSFEAGERQIEIQIEGSAIETPMGPLWSIEIRPEGGLAPYTVDIAGDLPSEIAFDRETASLSGSLAAIGTTEVVIGAMDGEGSLSTTPLLIEIEDESLQTSSTRLQRP